MTQKIIVRGNVIQWVGKLFIPMGDFDWYELGMWAEPYIGQTLIISLEEPEEEPLSLEEELQQPLKQVLAPV